MMSHSRGWNFDFSSEKTNVRRQENKERRMAQFSCLILSYHVEVWDCKGLTKLYNLAPV